MKKPAVLILLLNISFAFGQVGHHKVEVSGGYSNIQVNGIIGDGEGFADERTNKFTRNTPVYGEADLHLNPGGLFPQQSDRQHRKEKPAEPERV